MDISRGGSSEGGQNIIMLKENTLSVKKYEANQKQHCKQVQPKTLILVEAKKLFIKNLFNYLNDIYNSL